MGWNIPNILVNEAIANKKGGSDPALAEKVSELETDFEGLDTRVTALEQGGGSGELYPSEETEVGLWGDQKLYRKVFTANLSSSGNSIDLGFPRDYVVRKLSGSILKSSKTYTFPYYASSSDYVYAYAEYLNGDYTAFIMKGNFSCVVTLIVDYTKPVSASNTRKKKS